MTTVHLPSQLAGFAANQRRLAVQAASLPDVFSELDKLAPMLRSQMFHPNGKLRQFIGLFVDNAQVTEVSADVQLQPSSQVMVVMSVAGG